jgi:uncharacterized protein (TIGR02453 family)
MPSLSPFVGFSKHTVKFLRELRAHNDKVWFDEHRPDYDQHVLTPARSFVVAMGGALRTIAQGVQADPRVNGSIFRIHRDTRFSPDKTPFKPNLGIFFWEGSRPKMECSGFYVHLEPPTLMLGVGMYQFTKELLPVYRAAVADAKRGAALSRALATVQNKGPYTLGGEHYKRVPRGYDADHPRADLLRHGGLYVGIEQKIPAELFGPDLVGICLERFRDQLPVHRWLVQL